MIELHNDRLVFSFPDVHRDAQFSLSFQRTLRIPDDNRTYPLPAGLGTFPIRHVDDFGSSVPKKWLTHGGVLLPMHQSEAMWINFDADDYPFAIKIAAGKINAVTGDAWSNDLSATPQDYVVLPEQPWLDGFCVQKGLIRQFIAMPLGKGFTAEEQLTGQAEHGGVQIIAYPMKVERYRKWLESRAAVPRFDFCLGAVCSASAPELGLAPGGLMRQEIYEDEFGLDAWDTSSGSRCFAHILNSAAYKAVTGENPPTEPITADEYKANGVPWFDYYGGDLEALEAQIQLAGLDSVAATKIKKGQSVDEPVVQIDPQEVKVLSKTKLVNRPGKSGGSGG